MVHGLGAVDSDSTRAAIEAFCRMRLRNAQDAEDATQEVFLRAAERFPSGAAPPAWLFTVARNVCVDLVRSQLRRQSAIDELAPVEMTRSQTDFETRVIARLDTRSMLDGLTHLERAVVVGRCLRDLTFDQIGHLAGTRADAARHAFLRARRKMAVYTDSVVATCLSPLVWIRSHQRVRLYPVGGRLKAGVSLALLASTAVVAGVLPRVTTVDRLPTLSAPRRAVIVERARPRLDSFVVAREHQRGETLSMLAPSATSPRVPTLAIPEAQLFLKAVIGGCSSTVNSLRPPAVRSVYFGSPLPPRAQCVSLTSLSAVSSAKSLAPQP
jgi:RNA polymerase sigma factor (sigma-70 family)